MNGRAILGLLVICNLLVLLLMSCGGCAFTSEPTRVHPALAEDVREFYDILKSEGIEFHLLYHVVSIDVVEDLDSLGACYVYRSGRRARLVKIRADVLERSLPEFRKMIVFHELVHCACNYLRHDEAGLMKPALSEGDISWGGAEGSLRRWLKFRGGGRCQASRP
jgi:hypothetical protein